LGWMKRIIKNVARNLIRAGKLRIRKAGTRDIEVDINELEDTKASWRSAVVDAEFGELFVTLHEFLRSLDGRDNKVGEHMLKYFQQNHELPSVRQMAKDLQTSHGDVQRAREAVVAVWKPVCENYGFWPLV